MTNGARTETGDPGARRRFAGQLLSTARTDLEDARALEERGSVRGALMATCEAVFDTARAFATLRGLDPGPDRAALVALWNRQVGAEGIVSAEGAGAVQRALRIGREARAGIPSALYGARVRALRQAALGLLEEAEIVLGRVLEAVEPERPSQGDESPEGL